MNEGRGSSWELGTLRRNKRIQEDRGTLDLDWRGHSVLSTYLLIKIQDLEKPGERERQTEAEGGRRRQNLPALTVCNRSSRI